MTRQAIRTMYDEASSVFRFYLAYGAALRRSMGEGGVFERKVRCALTQIASRDSGYTELRQEISSRFRVVD